MCGGGGGGGDGGAAERKAAEDARVAAAINNVNGVFGVDRSDPAYQRREALYAKVGQDANNRALFDLNRDRANTERETNFTLARQGLSGGSRDVDANRQILDTFNQGVLQAGNIANNTSNTARMADDKTRVNLVNDIRSGLDSGNATQMAYEGMNNNINAANANAGAVNLNGFFNALNSTLNKGQYQSGFDQALLQQDPRLKQTQGGGAGSATSNYDGAVRST